MKATMISLAVSLVLTTGSSPVSAQTVAGGIYHSGSTLEVRAKAGGGDVTGSLTEVQFTIRWQSSYGVSLGNVSSPTYSIGKNGSEGIQSEGGVEYKYQEFLGFYLNGLPISWSSGVEQSLMTIPVNQTGAGVGTFELAPADFISGIFDDWYVELEGSDVTNSTFYQGSTADVPLPIQLASFSASVVRGSDVEVAWRTVSETNNYGFEMYRKRNENGEWEKLGFIEGHGTTLAAHSYTYLDKSVGFGNYYYQIKQIDLDGKSQTYPEMNVIVGVAPGQFVLAQNYPNPFNPTTTIEFVVPITGHTTMKVYNVLGQEVATLFEGDAEAGRINVARFNSSNLASGLYFYTLRSAGKVGTKRMLLLK
jgi:hypothetical protein